jgi:hypothetical protein
MIWLADRQLGGEEGTAAFRALDRELPADGGHSITEPHQPVTAS